MGSINVLLLTSASYFLSLVFGLVGSFFYRDYSNTKKITYLRKSLASCAFSILLAIMPEFFGSDLNAIFQAASRW